MKTLLIFCALIIGCLASDQYGFDTQDRDPDGEGCPGIESCTEKCLMDRMRDSNGCFTCECKQLGVFEGNIITDYVSYPQTQYVYGMGNELLEYDEPPKTHRERVWFDSWKPSYRVYEIPFEIDWEEAKKYGLYQTFAKIFKNFKYWTCIKFVQRWKKINKALGEKDDYFHVQFTDSESSSYVGRQGGKQWMFVNKKAPITEVYGLLMQVLGFWHEQSRSDRDEHVTIHWDNIKPGYEQNFYKRSANYTQLDTIYDARSVLHYKWNQYAKDPTKPTITYKNGESLPPPPWYLTYDDIYKIDNEYLCPKGKIYNWLGKLNEDCKGKVLTWEKWARCHPRPASSPYTTASPAEIMRDSAHAIHD